MLAPPHNKSKLKSCICLEVVSQNKEYTIKSYVVVRAMVLAAASPPPTPLFVVEYKI